jgi:hypothetical protein
MMASVSTTVSTTSATALIVALLLRAFEALVARLLTLETLDFLLILHSCSILDHERFG